MTRRVAGLLSLALGLTLLLAQSLVGPLQASQTSSHGRKIAAPAQNAAIASRYGQLPLAFEMNAGQADAPVRFLAHGSGYTLALTPSAALLALAHGSTVASHSRVALPGQPAAMQQPAAPPTMLDMQWLGANLNLVVTGEDPLPGTVNYFIGSDPAKWHTHIPTYQQVRLHNVYPGVDLVYYGTNGQLEYDFVVAPGANPAAIQLGFAGDQHIGVDLQGTLSLALPGGAIAQEKPLIYQTVNGARQAVAGGYTLASNGRVGFALGAYNPHLPLVIDPAYRFSTYLGGVLNDGGNGIAVDASGNAYVVGFTGSSNFPTHNPLQGSDKNSSLTVFVSKFNAAGTALIYSTYLGGSTHDEGHAIAVDSNGNAYVTGYTLSTDFPTTAGAFQTHLGGNPATNAFVSKLNASGTSLLYSTYLGGSLDDMGNGIAVDSSGNAYVTGNADSNDFPTTVGAFQPHQNSYYDDAFITKLNPSGSALVYSTYLGGSNTDVSNGIAVDGGGDAYITGYTASTDLPTQNPLQPHLGNSGYYSAYVSKLNAAGSALVYSTYLGGTGGDEGYGIAVDANGNAYITGWTASTDFPTHNPLQAHLGGPTAWNSFVSVLDAAGTAFVYSTYLGGSVQDQAAGIAVDASGDAYVTGVTYSPDFPTASPLQATNKATYNAFVSKLNATGSALLYSSYLGGSGEYNAGDYGASIAVGAGAVVYVTGTTTSFDFPTANALFSGYGGSNDAFVTKIATRPSVDTTTGVFRPSNGVLYLKNANTTGPADIALNYGLPGDQPITGDWTGKGYKSIGIYRNGTFYLRNSNTTGYADSVVAFGAAGDIPVAGDWTGKGYDSVGVYRPSNSTFYLRDTNTSGPPDHVVTLGISGDVPIVGDWTGKGWDSVGVFRPSNGIVYLRNSNTTGFADIAFTYGIAGDKPVVGDWDGNGIDTIGVDRAGNFLLRNSNTTGPANLSFYLGVSGDDPIAGPWLAPVGGTPPPAHRGPSTPTSQSAVVTPTRRTAPARR